jgi:6-phosphogluconolactonase
MKPEIHVHADLEALSRAVAETFVQLARQRAREAGRFPVALSGGSTPRRLYELLGSPEFALQVEWSKVHIFQVDERMVPPEHASSNFRMIRESLLKAASIPEENVHRILGELPQVESAGKYEDDLVKYFSAHPPDFPRFDLLFLGMGADGHSASLFPGSRALGETKRWVVPSEPSPEGLERVTLTLPVLNNARNIIFLVTGAEKSDTLARALETRTGGVKLPVELIVAKDGAICWHCDAGAASKLKRN